MNYFIFKKIIIISLLILPISSFAREACKDGSIKSQDIINCLMIDYEKSDQELNQLYWKITHKLPNAQRKQLKESQILWIKSKNECDQYYDQGAEGRFHVIACKTVKTKKRIQYLKLY